MPKAVEQAIDKSLSSTKGGEKFVGKFQKKRKFKSMADARKSATYAIMTNMQKKGEIPAWRKLKK